MPLLNRIINKICTNYSNSLIKIYLAATMNYGLGSDDPEELAYYNKIRKEMDDMKKEPAFKNRDTF